MLDLARQVLTIYKDSDRDTYLDNQFRLQMVAHDYAQALESLLELRTFRRSTNPGRAAWVNVQCAIPTSTGPEQAQAFLDARIAEGSDYIKIIHEDGSMSGPIPMLDNATLRALVEAAHKRGKLVVVHALSEQKARDAISSGADGLAHIFFGETASPDFGQFVTSSTQLPLADQRGIGFKVEGAPEGEFHIAENERISPGYFHAMGIPLHEGRATRHIHRKNWIAPDRKLRYLS